MNRFRLSRKEKKAETESGKPEKKVEKTEVGEKQTNNQKKTRLSRYLEYKQQQKKESSTDQNLEIPKKKMSPYY